MNSWETSAFSKNSTPVEIDEALLQEKVVILLQGKNVFGDQIFSYLQLTLKSLQQLKSALNKSENFMPADFGTVLAAGKGEPSNELRSEMAVTYNMIDVPKARAAAPKPEHQVPPKPQAKPAPATSGAAPAQTPSFGAYQPKLWEE